MVQCAGSMSSNESIFSLSVNCTGSSEALTVDQVGLALTTTARRSLQYC